MRNFLATLIFSQGTPMILAGDEFARTQKGNNNAYAQDNEISWIDWDAIDDDARALTGFTRKLIQLRKDLPVLRRNRFLTGAFDDELQVKDVAWLSPTGAELTQEQWSDAKARSLGVLLDGRAQSTGIRKRGHDVTVLLLLNAYHEPVEFSLPQAQGGSAWDRLVDTNEPEAEKTKFAFKKKYLVTGRSLVLFQLVGSEKAKKA
jgi:glycogen operon protein